MKTADAGAAIPVAPELLSSILRPYKDHCKYLKRAVVDRDDAGNWYAMGDFEIPESWYIDDTGHFNSIEFNICYNQLVYVLIGQCVASKLVPGLDEMSIDEYRRRQLPDVLITRFQSSFKKAMDSDAFRGRVTIDRASNRGRLLMLRTSCEFHDEEGGFSEGDVTLAIVDRRGDGAGEA